MDAYGTLPLSPLRCGLAMYCAVDICTFYLPESLFFFFQAEDGIRDYKVTGVQTCALPICRLQAVQARHAHVHQHHVRALPAHRGDRLLPVPRLGHHLDPVLGLQDQAEADPRSEERRVGKECRSRWSPYH